MTALAGDDGVHLDVARRTAEGRQVFLIRRRRARLDEAEEHLEIVDEEAVILVGERFPIWRIKVLSIGEIDGFPRQLIDFETAADAVDSQLLVELEGDLLEIVPGPVLGRQGDSRLLEGIDVQHHGIGVGAEADRVEFAVDAPGVEDGLGDVGEVDGLGRHVRVERLEQVAALPLGYAGVVLLHDVGQLASGGHRRHLGPEVVKSGEFVGDRYVRIEFLIHFDDFDRRLVADLGAPPGDLEFHFLALGEGAGYGDQG